MLILYANLCVVVMGAFCLRKVYRDLNHWAERSFLTALFVWIVYVAHTALAAWASWFSIWPLHIDLFLARAVGLALLVAGSSIGIAGMLEFHSLARISGCRPDRLIQTGVYHWTRNPQNVGWGLALLGAAICGRSAAALLLAAEFWLVFRLYIPWEERFLKQVYSDQWPSYIETTPRFFGLPRDYANEAAPGRNILEES